MDRETIPIRMFQVLLAVLSPANGFASLQHQAGPRDFKIMTVGPGPSCSWVLVAEHGLWVVRTSAVRHGGLASWVVFSVHRCEWSEAPLIFIRNAKTVRLVV